MVILLSALAVGFILTGCGSKHDRPLENAVQTYNRLIPIVFESKDLKNLSNIVSPTEYHRIESYIEYQEQQGKPIRAKLERLEFVESKSKKDKGYVKTREWWLYRYEDGQDWDQSPLKIYYEVRYDLVRNKKWLVDKLNITKSETPLTKKFNGRYISFSYPENIEPVSPEESGYQTGGNLEFITLTDPGRKETEIVVVVSPNNTGLEADYKTLSSEIKQQYRELYPGTNVTGTEVVKIKDKKWLKVNMSYTFGEKAGIKKVQYAYIGKSRIYWLTFSTTPQGHQDSSGVPESIMKTVILK